MAAVELLVCIAVREHGGTSWAAVAEAVRPIIEKMQLRVRSPDECRVLFQAVRARGPADAPLDETIRGLRVQRMAELRAEAAALEVQAERLVRDLAALDAGERDDIATLLAMLPPGAPLVAPPAAPAGGEPPSKAATAQLLKMLNAIAKHKWAYPFKRPVTDKEAPDYKDIIKQPMDFSTIRKRIEAGQVSTLGSLRDDLALVFSNAQLYNSTASDYSKMAASLQQHAALEMQRLLAETASASHLSPEASELLRGAGVSPAELKSASTRLRSAHPADGAAPAGGAGGGEAHDAAGDEASAAARVADEPPDGPSPLAVPSAARGADADGASGGQPQPPAGRHESPAPVGTASGRKRERGSEGAASVRVRSRR
ncbi:hypothetical protein KFE25_013899 [Diacronema lutheri]|uniref:Bromo domain-containing protein n=2 Tax=Diacronema lutheri TaxID=2081491 RepID=A0A8J5XFC9_DIALT|nr:hypothetical protein KFE25_013899 [Diacronema lutheri]